MNLENLLEKLQSVGTEFGLKLLACLAILIIGRWLVRRVSNVVRGVLTRAKVDQLLVRFVGNLVSTVMLIFVILAAVGQLGVQTTSLIAVLGAAGLAVGLALQGSLANFAAGVLIMIFRPYKVGDFIEAAHSAGVVEEVQIFTTILVAPDNKKFIVPNGQIMSGTITNFSALDLRRVDLVAGVSYSDNLDHVRTVLLALLSAEPRILQDPAPSVGVLALADSSVNLAVRGWVKTEDYWPVFFDLNEQIKKRFDAEGISIPFPQRDVHVFQHAAPATPGAAA